MPAGSDAPAPEGDPLVAVDVGGTKIAAGLVRGAAVTDTVLTKTPHRPGVADLVAAVREAVGRLPEVPGPVAVATAGLVRGGALQALNDTFDIPDWQPFKAPLEAALGRPVGLLNDAHAATWGEYRHGAGRGAETMVFLTISTGIGGGIVAGGRLLTGHQGLAGSIGQVRLALGDAASPTLEEVASGTGLARRAGERLGRPMDARAVLRLGDAKARAVLAEMADAVAGAIAGLAATVDPQVVVLGGGVGLVPEIQDAIGTALQRHPPLYRPRLAAAALGAEAGLVGCADWVQMHCGMPRRR